MSFWFDRAIHHDVIFEQFIDSCHQHGSKEARVKNNIKTLVSLLLNVHGDLLTKIELSKIPSANKHAFLLLRIPFVI